MDFLPQVVDLLVLVVEMNRKAAAILQLKDLSKRQPQSSPGIVSRMPKKVSVWERGSSRE